MNERIKKLLDKATIKDHWSVDENRYLTHYVDHEQFAELIVRECIAVMDITAKEAKEHHVYIDDDVPTSTHQYKIKQHFGVEE